VGRAERRGEHLHANGHVDGVGEQRHQAAPVATSREAISMQSASSVQSGRTYATSREASRETARNAISDAISDNQRRNRRQARRPAIPNLGGQIIPNLGGHADIRMQARRHYEAHQS
jgi:hypothetical protein